jgi:hypothetical protein
VCLVFLLALVTAISAPVLAKTSSGTDTIARDSYKSFKVEMNSALLNSVTFTATVNSGPNIDVFFMESSDYDLYKDGSGFDYYTYLTDFNVSSATETSGFLEVGTYYFVLDNTDAGTPMPINPAVPAATVAWTLDVQNSKEAEQAAGFMGLAIGLCIAVIVIGIVIRILILIWVYKDAEKRGTSGVMWLIIVFLLGIIGLIIYLIVRPKVPVMPPPGYAPPPPGYAPPPPGYAPPPPGYQQPPPPQQPPQAPPQQ